MFWTLVLVACLLVLVLLLALDRWSKNVEFEKIPGPRGIFIFENALDFLMDPVKLFYYFRTLANTYKDVFKIKLGPRKLIIVFNPEDVEVVISGTKYNSKGFLYNFITPWLNEGLLLSDGSKWHHRRKILTPAFHFNILCHFNRVLEENSRCLVHKLENEVGKSKTNISSYMTEFTLHSICETAMGCKLDQEASDVGKNYKQGIHALGQYIVHRAQRVWMHPNLIFSITPTGRKQKQILKLLSSFRDNVIKKRRESCDFINMTLFESSNDKDILMPRKKRLAMLDLLLQTERNGDIDAQGIGEEVDTFIFEGHDTTATALQFIFMLLANNPISQDKIFDEHREIFGSSTRAPTMNDLSQMKYLECCIKESLRLYPPVHVIARKVSQPLKLKNYEVPAGSDCTILIYDLHRRNDQFIEPLEFRPERFLVESTWHPYAYIPFSAGPRNCIGQKFAMIEMKLAVSAVLSRYRLLPVTRPQDVIFVTDFILRPKDPIYVKFEIRDNSIVCVN